MSDKHFDVFGLFLIAGILGLVLIVALAPAVTLIFFSAPAWVMPWAWAWDRLVMVLALALAISLLRV